MIDEELNKNNLNWKQLAELNGKNPSNFKRTFTGLITKINNWLEPLNLEITFKQKKK